LKQRRATLSGTESRIVLVRALKKKEEKVEKRRGRGN
jgi:hypothetical protein